MRYSWLNNSTIFAFWPCNVSLSIGFLEASPNLRHVCQFAFQPCNVSLSIGFLEGSPNLHHICGFACMWVCFWPCNMSLSIGFLEVSTNLHHICGHVTGALKHAHHLELIINKEARVPPKHQIMWHVTGHCRLVAVVSLEKLWQVVLPLSLFVTPACQTCERAVGGNVPLARYTEHGGSALLDTEDGTQLLHQGGCEVHTPIAQKLRRHPKKCS